MAIVKVRVNLKDAKTNATRSRAERVDTTRFMAKRVGDSLSAPKSETKRVGAAISRDERLGIIDCAERLGVDKTKVEKLDANIARAETNGVDICRVMADTAKFKRADPYTSRFKRANPYTSRFKRAGPYTSIFKRAGPYTSRSERVGPYTARSERVGPYTARSERVGPYTARSERVGLYTARSERVYTSRCKRDDHYTARSDRVGPNIARSYRSDPYRSKFGRAYANRVGDEKKVGADRERYERVDAYATRYESAYTAKVGRVVAFNRARIEKDGVKRARDEKPSSYTSRVGRAGAYTTRVEGASAYTTRFGRVSAYRIRDEKIGACRARAGVYRAMDDRSSVTLKLKRPRVEDIGNLSKRHRSVKGDSIKRKEDQNTSHHGLGKQQLLLDHNHSDMTVTCRSFDVSQQHVPYLEVEIRSEVKKDLKVLEDSSAKSTEQNWSKEHHHKTNTVSKNFATNLDSENHHSIIGRKIQPSSDYHQVYQPSMHVEFATNLSVELEHKDRKRVKGALKAYQEILSKFMGQKCNSRYVKAAMVLKKQGKWVNTTKQVGSIGGLKVGDKFLYRAQLNVVGLHREFDKGIDYMRRNDGKILATSIVDSGRYVNNLESPDILIYSGQGGKSLYDKNEPKNQIMEGGNLALRNSQEEGTPVRVIRKLKRYKGSCYVYYGLYTVERVMEETEHGIMIYKFRLRRKSGQPELLFDSS